MKASRRGVLFGLLAAVVVAITAALPFVARSEPPKGWYITVYSSSENDGVKHAFGELRRHERRKGVKFRVNRLKVHQREVIVSPGPEVLVWVIAIEATAVA